MDRRISLLVLALSFTAVWGQPQTDIDDIRLAGRSNGYSGRVEIKYNGTWGTICDGYWSSNDANVACRMLGFSGAECARSNAYFGRASTSLPIWMDRLLCNGRETYLDNCPFRGWGPRYVTCSSTHRDDASAVCRNESLFSTPTLSMVNATTRAITVTFPAATTTVSLFRSRYRIQFNTSGSSPRYYYYTPPSARGPYFATIPNLVRNTNYSIAVRLEVISSYCRYYASYAMYSSYSTPVTIATNNTVRPSAFDIRLAPAIRGLDFMGRVEVNYKNGGWGTVCDYRFDNSDANVICRALNFTRAVCSVYNARTGRGSGKILLTGLICSAAEILDDCTYTFYRTSSYSLTRNCRTTHYDDAGVICLPDEGDFLQAPQNFSATSRGSSVIFKWKRYIYPSYVPSRRLRIDYTRSDRTGRYVAYASATQTTLTLYRITLGVTFNATISAQGRFTQYSCYNFVDGDASDRISVSTMERPPSTAPRNFHISVVNCSAIIAEWDSPFSNNLNGILRGYKLIYRSLDGGEISVDLPSNVTEYIIGELQPATGYTVNVLAYTVGDGPRSIHLTVTTNKREICQTDIINFFGINGNDLDKITLFSFSTSVNIFCGSNLPNVQIQWFYSNGTRVGTSNRHLREGHFPNGTSILQIGNERRLTLCDAGIYTCRANVTTNKRAEQRTFKLTFNRAPPTPGRPVVLKTDPNSATVSWPKSDCSGGHDLQFYTIRIGYYRYSFYRSLTYRYIYSIDARMLNYTLVDLTPRTNYYVSLRAIGKDDTASGFSSSITVVTLAPAPTPPRYVNVVLINPNTIMVNWTRPSVSNGVISYYTGYATPFITRTSLTPRNKRSTDSLQSVSKNFSSTMTSGELTLPQLGVEYHIQVSVTVLDTTSRTNRESLFSSLTPDSTLFVPVQGLPIASNVRVSSSTNNSLTVTWTAPASNGDTLTGFLVEYSGLVDGKSPKGMNIRYRNQGNYTTAANVSSFIVQPLVPQTSYQLKVSSLTTRGEGKQVATTGTTSSANSDFERYVYFHVRFGPVLSCSAFRRDIGGQEDVVNKQIFDYLKQSCNCGFTDANIETGFFSCGQQDHQIIYRAHILGTGIYSAIDLVNLLQNWIRSNRAYVTLNNFRMKLDPTCPTRLDTLYDPECPIVTQAPPTTAPTTPPTTPPTTTTPTTPPAVQTVRVVTIHEIPTVPKPIATTEKTVQPPKETEKPEGRKEEQRGITQPQAQHGVITGSSLVILFVGLIIAFLLVILIVLVIVVAFWKLNKQSSVKSNKPVRRAFTNQESVMRFSELEKSGENNYEEEKIDDTFHYNGDTDKFDDNFS